MQPSKSDWAAAFALFDQALDLEAPQRERWLGSLAGPDARVLVLLRELLAHHDQIEEDGFLLQLPPLTQMEGDAAARDNLAPGQQIGPYSLIERLGTGGMGSVWLAERVDKLLDRKVALKLPHTGWAMPDFAARLRHERQLLASLEHPRIARLYDAGIAPDGRPWLALEVVRGEPINTYCNHNNLTSRDRLKLVLQVAQAVAYAHSRLIVHRDLKPSNILVDSQGEVHLLDFGIGKLLDPAQPDDGATRFGSRAFTPDYGSPEQLRGDPVTTATDIYSLGVVLYELLTGQRPHRRTAEISIEHAVATLEPQPPSQVATVGAAPKLSADLDAIVLEALEKNPASRFPTVAAFADDIERYLGGQPVHARSGSGWYRATKFFRRHLTGVIASVLVLVAILAGGAISIWQARAARAAAARAEAIEAFLVSIFQQNSRNQPDPLQARATTARQLLDAGAARLRTSEGNSLPPDSRDGLRELLGNLYVELSMFKEAVAVEEERVASLRSRGLQSTVEYGMALVDLGSALQSTDRGERALPVLREAESVSNRHPEDARLAGYVSSYLANQLVYTNSAEALRHAKRAVLLLKRAEPRGDEMLGALLMIADTERTVDPAAAETAGIQALDLIRATRGSSHQLYAQTALMLAEIQSARMEDSAEPNFLAAESVAATSTEPGHFLRLQTDLRYGLMEVDQNRFDAGYVRLNRALADSIAVNGRDDLMYVSWAHENLARAAWRYGNLEAAQREAAECLRILDMHPRDERYAKTADVAFDAALERGDLRQAGTLIEDSRFLREKTGGIHEGGFREQVLFREAQLTLAHGATQQALDQFSAVADAPVPGLLRFLEVKLRARVGAAKAAHVLGDDARAAREARAALDEVAALGNRLALRQVSAQAWTQLAIAEASSGRCEDAHAAREHAAALLAVTDGPDSFRHRWLDNGAGTCN